MMKLPDATRNGLTVQGYQHKLEADGYKRLGWGSFGSVYARSEDDEEVIKVGNDVNADGYLQFLRWVGLRSSNPHLPYVKSIEIFDNEPNNPHSVPYYVVRMERLNDRPTDWRQSYANEGHALRQALLDMGIRELDQLAYPEDIQAKNRHVLYVKGMLTELFKTHAKDIKFGNVLFRDNTLVITDPVAYQLVY